MTFSKYLLHQILSSISNQIICQWKDSFSLNLMLRLRDWVAFFSKEMSQQPQQRLNSTQKSIEPWLFDRQCNLTIWSNLVTLRPPLVFAWFTSTPPTFYVSSCCTSLFSRWLKRGMAQNRQCLVDLMPRYVLPYFGWLEV